MLLLRRELGPATIFVCILGATLCSALGEQRFVGFGESLINAPLIVDKGDFKGVQIATESLSGDFSKVTGKAAKIRFGGNDTQVDAATAIIVGSISSSSIIKGLACTGKINVADIEGKWESSLAL